MKRSFLIWTLTVISTLAFLVWQKVSGPTYEVKFDETVAGARASGELLRTHSINGDLPVTVHAPDPAVTPSSGASIVTGMSPLMLWVRSSSPVARAPATVSSNFTS